METLATMLKQRQHELGWSNRKLAREIGIAHTTIARIYKGEQIGLETANKIADYLGVNPGTILDLESTDETERVSAAILTLLEKEPRLKEVFIEALQRVERGEVSPEALQDLISYAAFRFNQ